MKNKRTLVIVIVIVILSLVVVYFTIIKSPSKKAEKELEKEGKFEYTLNETGETYVFKKGSKGGFLAYNSDGDWVGSVWRSGGKPAWVDMVRGTIDKENQRALRDKKDIKFFNKLFDSI